jgi:hypothetical protein
MAEDRNQQPDPQSAPLAPLLTAEVLRHAASACAPTAKGKGEDGVSPFWRLFGATILSIVALAAVTLYQQLAGGLSEVRHELGQLTRKEEFVASRGKVWEKVFEIQKNTEHGDVVLADRCARLEQQLAHLEAARKELLHELAWLRAATVAALKDRSGLLEQQVKTGQAGYQEMARALQHLHTRLAALEGRPAAAPPAGSGLHPGE